MRRRLLVGLVVAAMGACVGGASSSPAGATGGGAGQASPEVLGGTPAAPGAYPYNVAIVRTAIPGLPIRALRCGGVLISPDTVLTAAHCVFYDVPNRYRIDSADDIDVIVGGTDLGLSADGERVGVRRIVYQPGFDPVSRSSNIAVLQLDAAVGATPVAVAAPDQDTLWGPGTPGTLVGFGQTAQDYYTPPSSVLMQATMPVIDPSECAAAYGVTFDASQHLCAGDFEVAAPDACPGDGGAGLVVDGGGAPLVVGLVSFNTGHCGRSTLPAVYARVDTAHDFIEPYLDPDTAPDPPRRVHIEWADGAPTVRWRRPGFDGGTAITGYRVTVHPGATVIETGGSARSARLGPTDQGRTYTVRVRAVNTVGAGQARTVTLIG